MNNYKRLLIFIKPYWHRLAVAALCVGIVSITTGLTAWIVKPVLDDVFIKKDLLMLKRVSLGLILIFLVKGICRFVSSYFLDTTGQRIVMDIRNVLFRHIQKLSLKFFYKNHSGHLLSRIINDVGIIQEVVAKLLGDFVLEFFTMIFLIGVVFYQDFKLAFISIFVFPLSLFFMLKIGKKMRELGRKGQEKIADMSRILLEVFSGIRIIKAFRREEYESERFAKENMSYFKVAKKSIKYAEMTSPIMEFLGALGFSMVIIYGGKKVISGESTTGTFFSFMAGLSMLYSPIRRLSNINNVYQQALSATQRIFEIIDTPSDIAEKKDALEISDICGELTFDQVSFKYEDKIILNNISLKVKKGEKVAFVGASGVGKTTLIDLIPRYYDVTAGSIAIDGIDLRDATLSSLRRQIGIVSQDTYLFNDSIKNNIRYGNLSASEEELFNAAKAAFAHSFILELPLGYDTILGERGVTLSGGQRQRIAIARALIKNPPILILDEATSALDLQSEKVVQLALDNLMQNRTTFIVAHRLSTVINTDKIFVLENGIIAEVGRHKELLDKGGVYKKIYETQILHS